MSKIGERIRQLRREFGMTQQSFARTISISRSHVANLETGGSEPSDHILSLMCEKFGVSSEWLKHGQGVFELQPRDLDENQRILFDRFLETLPFRSALAQLQSFSKFYDQVANQAAKYLIHSLGVALKADPALCPIELIEALRDLLSKREGEPFQSAEKLLQRCEPHAKPREEGEFYL